MPLTELAWRFSAAGGPGGQHVNTSNTKAEVRFDVARSPSLPPETRERLLHCLGPVVIAVAGERRSQARNRELALSRLAQRLEQALRVAPRRRPTRPTAASQRRRVEAKRRHGERKRERRSAAGSEDS